MTIAVQQPSIDETIHFIERDVYKGAVDKSGRPTFEHSIRVMKRLGPHASLEMKLAALLHDAIEDTQHDGHPITPEQLHAMGYSYRTVELVELLTSIPGHGVFTRDMDTKQMKFANDEERHQIKTEKYADWIKALIHTNDWDALRLKKADIDENMERESLEKLTETGQNKRWSKYWVPRILLGAALDTHQLKLPASVRA